MGYRWACAAGTFYPADPLRLSAELARCLGARKEELGPPGPPLVRPVGLILPHAGYRYSGEVAGAGYRALWRLGQPEVAVILGTNHTGLGGPIALAEPGAWETPLGPMPIHRELTPALARALGADLTDVPFVHEHSVEVQLPFLRYLYGELPFVAAVVQPLSRPEAEAAGAALAEALAKKPALLLCSTDFTHYEPHAVAREKDLLALRHVLNLDLAGFLEVVRAKRISICGVGALALFLAAAKALRLLAGELLLYRTSGEVAGPMDQVVGYAAALFREVDEVA
ncbi:MAG: AmmeMemoRadiSam system protein B [Candidatus Bipolaricaulaceae bacterium]